MVVNVAWEKVLYVVTIDGQSVMTPIKHFFFSRTGYQFFFCVLGGIRLLRDLLHWLGKNKNTHSNLVQRTRDVCLSVGARLSRRTVVTVKTPHHGSQEGPLQGPLHGLDQPNKAQ